MGRHSWGLLWVCVSRTLCVYAVVHSVAEEDLETGSPLLEHFQV